MAIPKVKDRLTIDMPLELREELNRLAQSRGQSAGECVRRILTEKFAQLQQGQESP